MQVDYIRSRPPRTRAGAVICPYWDWYTFWAWVLPPLPTMPGPGPPSECSQSFWLVHITHNIASDPGTHPMARECNNGLYLQDPLYFLYAAQAGGCQLESIQKPPKRPSHLSRYTVYFRYFEQMGRVGHFIITSTDWVREFMLPVPETLGTITRGNRSLTKTWPPEVQILRGKFQGYSTRQAT